MKKIFTALLICMLFALSVVSVNADKNNKLLNDKWSKALGSVNVTEKMVGGEKITVMSGITSSYASAAIDIMPTIEKLMGDNDEIDVWIVLDVRVDAEDGAEFPFGMKIRAEGTTDLVKTEAAFNENYTEATTFRHRGSGGISISAYPSGTLTNKWQRIEIQQNFTAYDLNKDFWKKWNLCFDMMKDYANMGAIEIKNTGIYLYDEYESGSEAEENEVTDSGTITTGQNRLLNDKWTKLYGNVTIKEETIDDEKITTISGLDSSYATGAIDIMPTIAKLMGKNDEIDVWIVLDIRIDTEDDEEFPVGMKIRADGLSNLVKTAEAFGENYTEASTFQHRGGAEISISAYPKTMISNQWHRIEIMQNFTAFDLNKDFWKKWNLCFDMMSEYEDMGNLQIKNVGIYLIDEYESVAAKEDETDKETTDKTEKVATTPAPAKIHKPYGFNKYTVNFAETIESDMSEVDIEDKKTDPLPIIIAGVAIVAVVGGAAIFIVKKNKKKGSAE